MRLAAIVLLSFVTGVPMAWGASNMGDKDFPLPPDAQTVSDQTVSDTSASDDQPLSVNMPIEKLAANPGAVAILDSDLPGLLEDSNYSMFKSMSLKTVASLSGGRIPADTVKDVDAQLKAMPVTTPVTTAAAH